MTESEVAELQVGDIIKHQESGLDFIICNTTDDVPQAVALIHVEKPEEFERVERI